MFQNRHTPPNHGSCHGKRIKRSCDLVEPPVKRARGHSVQKDKAQDDVVGVDSKGKSVQRVRSPDAGEQGAEGVDVLMSVVPHV